jgi:hypothetical protein
VIFNEAELPSPGIMASRAEDAADAKEGRGDSLFLKLFQNLAVAHGFLLLALGRGVLLGLRCLIVFLC